MITSKDIKRFTDGDCHILARALSRITGWKVVTLQKVPRDCPYNGAHAACIRPDGKVVDVEGLWLPDDLLARYRAERLCEISDVNRLIREWPHFYGNYSYLRAHHVARFLAREHALIHRAKRAA